jgi:hypothetical protein
MIDTSPKPVRLGVTWTAEEPPACGRWRGGPVTARMRNRGATFSWHPGDGCLSLTEADGVETLLIEDSGHTLAGLLAAIRVDDGRTMPRMALGEIDVTGIGGHLTLGAETIRFRGVARIAVGGWSLYPARAAR